MMGKRRGTAQITTRSAGSLRTKLSTQKPALHNSIAALLGSCNMRPGVIFELRWSARIPLARPGGAGHDGKTSWCGSNRNGVAGRLRSQLSTQKPALFAARSLAVYSRRNMILKPSLSFAGPREYRWQGLEVPVMMEVHCTPPLQCMLSRSHSPHCCNG